MKRILIFTIILVSLTAGCTDQTNSTSLIFQSSNTALAARSRSVEMDTGIEITKFILSIREVEFKLDETSTAASDIFFDGPYVIDLIDSTGALSQTIGAAEIPPATYQTLRFKLHKSTDTADPDITDRSIFIAGTIDSVPFEMWHDASENLDIAESTGITVAEGAVDVVIDFNIRAFLDQSANAADGGTLIDLSTATDDDSDGTIEINPNSEDSNTNKDLADALKDNIKLVADLIE